MIDSFPSIWIELENETKGNTLIGGFYRQWSHDGLSNGNAQQTGIEVFTNQIETSYGEGKKIINMGDAILCARKWKEPKFLHKNVSNQLINLLIMCGLCHEDICTTFVSDHSKPQDVVCESSLDHVYHN